MNPHDSHEATAPNSGPQVFFEHVNSLATAKIKADWDTTLTALWDMACAALGEPRRPDDRLQSTTGDDLMTVLQLTLRQAQDQKLLKGHHFQIVGPTGGACA